MIRLARGDRRRDTLVLAVSLPLCMAVGPLMLYTLAAVSPLVIEDLEMSDAQYGAVSAVTFISAAGGAFFLGGQSARFTARHVMMGIAIGSGVSLGLLAAATNYVVVLVVAIIAGVAQSLSNPATNRIAAGLPVERRGALIGWKQSGVQMAQLVAGLLAPGIAVLWGWRWAALAGVVIAVLALWSAFMTREVSPTRSSGGNDGSGVSVSVGRLTAYTFFMAFGLMGTNAYLALFAHRELGLSVGAAGLTAAVVGAVGVASRVIFARASGRSGLRRYTLVSLAVGAAAGVALILASSLAGHWLVWLGAAVFGAAALASNAVTMVALVCSVPAGALSSATGAMVTAMYFGFATGPLGFGLVLHYGATFHAGWLLPLCSFAVAALVGLPQLSFSRRGNSASHATHNL